MKRALLFLVLLAVGLGILRLLQGPDPRGYQEPRPGDLKDWVHVTGADSPGWTPGGALTMKQFLETGELGQRPTELVLDAADSGQQDDGAGLFFAGVELRYLDPLTQQERMVVHAVRALAERVIGEGALEPTLANEIRLADVEVVVYEGTPIVPLTIRVPELVIDFERRTLTSSDPVTLSGPGIEGAGLGLFVDEPAGMVRVERQTSLRLDGYKGGGKLLSEGPLEVDRAEGSDVVVMSASGDARLLPLDDGGATEEPGNPTDGLWADAIVVRGRDEPGGAVSLRTVDAIGAVRYATDGNELLGGRAHLDLDDTGEPALARITEAPVALLAVDRAALGVGQPDETAPVGVVRVESDVALTIRWERDGTHVAADGPARIQGELAELFCEGAVTGLVLPGGDGASFHCADGVRLERAGAVLVTRTLDADVSRGEDGVPIMAVTARGRPLITGATADGRDLALSAEGVLEFEQRGARWSVPRAEKVELHVLGPDSLHARADLVEDFDPELVTMLATGNVQVETKEGTARGHLLDVQSRTEFTLTGDETGRVVFESAEGRAEAQRIERNGDSVTLFGSVDAHLVPSARAGELYDLDADELTLTRSEVAGDAGTTTVFELEARGVHDARVRRPGEGLDIACETLSGLYREDLDASAAPRERFSSFHATGVKRAVVLREGEVELLTRISSDELGATRTERFLADGTVAVQGEAIASGAVEFHGTAGTTPFDGTASEVTVDHEGTLFARAAEGEKVHLNGALPSNDKPYELEAAWVRATAETMEAADPEIIIYDTGKVDGGEADIELHARAHHMLSTREKLELEDDVHVDGRTETSTPWRLDAGYARFEGRAQADGGVTAGDILALVARRGVRLALPEHDMVATGETLTAKRLSGIMRLEGVPARITSAAAQHEAEWIEFDVNLGNIVGTGSGRIGGREPKDSLQDESGQAPQGWIEYRALNTLFEPDAIIYVLEEPRIHYQGPEIRAFFPSLPTGEMTISSTFAVFWIDRHGLADLPGKLRDREGETEQSEPAEPVEQDKQGKPVKRAPAKQRRLFDTIREFGVLNEVYLEGPVEISVDGQPNASASAVYLDIVSGNGWLADASFTINSDLVGRRVNKITVHARWLRQSDDYSFFADDAKVSLCEFDEPHLEITTGDLRITPSASDPRHFDVRLRDNSVRMYGLFTLPLPSIDYSTDEKGRPIIASLKLGSSARFGSFVSAGIVRPAEGAGKALHGLLGRGEFNVDVDVDAQYYLSASWLGSRGVLLDLGFLAEAKGEYRWLTEVGGIPDRRDDKGFIRVPKDDRDSLRLWLRTHGRYWFDSESWIDVVGTYQTDAGVQSEFFESDFTRYEQTETYLRWRKANGNHFTSAALVLEADKAFTGTDKLPTLQAYRGSAEILPLGPVSVTYGADASAEYLRRHESDGGYESPFGYPAVFADGLGDRETLRFDTTHRVEAPFGLGGLGLRATPFALARFTAWSEDVTETHSPVRAFGQVGLRIAAPLWKPAEGGGVHQFVPYVAGRRDVALQETGGDPVMFDEVEAPLEGEFVDVGFRGRISALAGSALLDLDVRATHASSVAEGSETGWTEIGMFSRLSVLPFGTPVQLTHDGRYDIETNDTVYSRIALGLRPTDALAFEAAHYRGLDVDREPLFEAASIRALYTWTQKWEFEGRQSFSLLEEGGRLGSAVILRRYGHDVVFEVESSFREGEGTSFGINIRPLFSFSRPDLGDLSF